SAALERGHDRGDRARSARAARAAAARHARGARARVAQLVVARARAAARSERAGARTRQRGEEAVTPAKSWMLTVLVSLASSCGVLEPRPDHSRYFVLASSRDLGRVSDVCAWPSEAHVGLGPVQIPEYLRQPELLTRTSPTELTRSYAERWSEPLETMLP